MFNYDTLHIHVRTYIFHYLHLYYMHNLTKVATIHIVIDDISILWLKLLGICLYVTGRFRHRINLVNMKGICNSQSIYPILKTANLAIKHIILFSHCGPLWHTFHMVINSSNHNWNPMVWCSGGSCNGKKHSKIWRLVHIVNPLWGQSFGLNSSNISCVAFNCHNNVRRYKISYMLNISFSLKKKIFLTGK